MERALKSEKDAEFSELANSRNVLSRVAVGKNLDVSHAVCNSPTYDAAPGLSAHRYSLKSDMSNPNI